MKKFLLSLLLTSCIVTIGRAQCPNVTIQERLHTPCQQYAIEHWDTAVNCNVTQLKLNANAFITTQHFNGTYLVESIPYNPPESFTAGIHLPISSDDIWDETGGLNIDFPFQFFGVTQNHIFMAANGLVSFNSAITPGMGSGYSWDGYYPINPTPTSPSDFLWPNSILACAGDMDPAYISTNTSVRGVFKYSGGEEPCRHITVSWSQVPLFGYSSEQATYHNTHQVVLWEGTNVIEVHVKNHHSNTTTTQVSGIGIINANGTSAFMAPGRNPFRGEIDENHSEAWRFTPQGSTVKTITWYKLTDSGDSIEVGANANDPRTQLAEGYYGSSDHMSCYVFPTVPTTYKVTIRYNGATGYFYYLTDTIRVGVDTNTNYSITSPQIISSQHAAACYGTRSQFNISFPTQRTDIESMSWEVTRTQNGNTTIVPEGSYTIINNGAILQFAPTATMLEDKTDTFHIYTTVVFNNGCIRSDSLLYEVYPNYQIAYEDAICDNQIYMKWGEQFVVAGDYTRRFSTIHGCDSVETLHLVVSPVNTTIESIADCKPITWRNGQTYYESNSATSAVDTVVIQNQYGCDSILQLAFTLAPVEARIEATPSAATIDRLNIQLIDVSIGANRREWTFPNGNVTMSQITSYNFDPREDSVTIGLQAYSQYGCVDDTTITLHLLKENIWIPNAFTPEEETNNRFSVSSVGIVYLQMYIYDRRGELVCKFEGTDGHWDGKDTNGELCKTGSYTYVCRYANIVNPNAILTKRGTITLLR